MDNIDNIINQLNNNLDNILNYNTNLQKNTINLLNIINNQSNQSNEPKKISVQLAKFMNVNETDYVSEIDVIKKIYKYVIQANLYNEANARYFRTDKLLETILDPLQEDEKEKGYNYFNVQRYFMKNYL